MRLLSRFLHPVIGPCPALIVAMLTGCGTEAPEATQDTDVASSPVVGGTPVAGECSWPSTVQVDAATGCTGTLIHPRVVTTAAHCLRTGGGTARITFGNSGSDRFSVTATCKAGASGQSGVSTGRDWGYCILPEDERILSVPTIAPIVGCEAEKFLKAGVNGWIVGFGSTGSNAGGFGVLRQVEVTINRVNASVLDVGDAQKGACHGDSGGPLYVQLRDGDRDYGFRLAGATSGPGGPCDCACSTVYVNIGVHVAAIEEDEGIDVTPCTDATGAWAPGPDCNQMQKEPISATGDFPECVVARTTVPIESCGPNGGSGGAGGSASTGGTTSSGGAGAGAGGSAMGGGGGMGAGGNNAGAGGSAAGMAGTVAGAGGNTAGTGGNAAGAAGAGAGTGGSAGTSATSAGAGGSSAGAGGAAITPGGGAPATAGTIAGGGETSGAGAQPATHGDEAGCGCATHRQERNESFGIGTALLALALYRRHRTRRPPTSRARTRTAVG